MAKEFRWGIISTGKIAVCFFKDLYFVDPKTRGVDDIVHKVVAVGSRDKATADAFLNSLAPGDETISAYGTYEQVYEDPNVDAIYIGTPHTYHYENALASIKAKKHVLCEKPVTSNAAELRSLLAAAKENGVFFMEALWTRFHPLALEVKKIINEGSLGKPIVLHADLSFDCDLKTISKTSRMVNPDLGGGALLDLGPYPLVWAIMALFEHPDNELAPPSNITGSMLKTPLTGVDSNTSFTVTFSGAKLAAQAILSCSINVRAADPGVKIRFEKGVINIAPPIFCPKSFTVEYFDRTGALAKEERRVFEYEGGGWHYQADEVARCAMEGLLESSSWGHNKSLLEMEIFDEVRRQGGYKFPEGVEKVV